MISPPSPPNLRLFGGAGIESNGVPLGGPAAHRHRLALLALLAVSRRPVSRDKLVSYLWPERETEPARNLLKTAVHELRKVLGENAIRSTGDALSIDPALLHCDVLEFEAAVQASELERAASLYGGPFLDGFFVREAAEFEHWTAAERARLERVHERVVAQLRDQPPSSRETDPVTPPPPSASASPAPVTRSRRTVVRVAAALALLAVAALAVGARFMSNHGEPPYKALLLPDDNPGSALEFDGLTANASTAAGSLATSQVDNIVVDMMVKYEGRVAKSHSVLYYNGHGAVSGWGVMLPGPGDGQPDGTIAVLAGGISIMATPLVLQIGKWQHLSVERREGKVTVTVDDRSFALGPLSVNPIRTARYRNIERTTLGGDGLYDKPTGAFHGAIDRVRIRDLETGYAHERFMLDEGKGPLTVGVRDMVLHVGNAKWIPGPRLPASQIFWDRIASICNQAYSGRVTGETPTSGEPQLRDSSVVIYAHNCTPNEIRVFLQVGADRSREFILRRNGSGVRIDHEVRRGDGTTDSTVHQEGAAIESGSVAVQQFVAIAGPKPVKPVAHDDGWQLEVEPREKLVYTVSRGAAERLRMEFDLKRQVASPALP